MPNPQHLNPDTMSQPRDYRHVVKVDNTVYIAGQVSTDKDGNIVGEGTPKPRSGRSGATWRPPRSPWEDPFRA